MTECGSFARMDFEVVAEFDAPRERVFAIFRDEVPALRQWLPNVSSFETRARHEAPEVVTLTNDWRAEGEIPQVARPFVPKDATGWTDHAVWDTRKWTCEWRTEPHAFRESVTSAGAHHFEALSADRTRVRMRGSVEVDAKKIPGVPRLLAGAVKPAVETFVVSTVKANLESFARAVQSYLRAK